jgi:hypothetical protein
MCQRLGFKNHEHRFEKTFNNYYLKKKTPDRIIQIISSGNYV